MARILLGFHCLPNFAKCAILMVFFVLLIWKLKPSILNKILSRAMDSYLRWKYPIMHIQDNRPIPTCPYRFPNGQGDVAKFLEGIDNSGDWGKKYGSVYRIWSGFKPEIVLTRPEHIQVVFRDSDKHIKATSNNSGYLMGQILGQCVGLISGSEWRTARLSTETPFLRKTVVEYVSLVQKHVSNHFTELWNFSNLKGGLLDPVEDLKMLPFWVVSEILYGELDADMVQELKKLAPMREELFKYVIRGGLSRFGASRYLPSKANTLLSTFQTRWKSFNDTVYQRALSSGKSATIVGMYESVKQGKMTRSQMLQTLDETLYANLDVTTGGLSWNVVFLAAYPAYQEALLKEFESVNPESHSRYFLSSSTLLSACISESSRLKPLASFSVSQSAPTERIIDGYLIPAGTSFVVDSHALNIQNEFWGQDSESYRPERFLEKETWEMRYHFWRFGFGPRQCMGKYVTDLIFRVLLVHFVEGYDLGLVENGEEWKKNPEKWIMHPQMAVKCVKKPKGGRK
ncbi:putative cytochrome P450 monooxygenase [Delitschia confertaspora ATCC 74209]|uniref:Cytochrome P450 monooxygenase n=1 Tax=Delitschia confertaspora ATCC 74209 TaxID=1513339 RepID=A0A9P4MYJ0_9PLEO|nr:putative cytochrome P450 monooxygenase [Delitschia confertaspora ATCC 74209]